MTTPVLLIAEREFRVYVATLSFWVALAVGPIALGTAVGLVQVAVVPPARVSILAPTTEGYREAAGALRETAALEGRAIVVLPQDDLSSRTWLELRYPTASRSPCGKGSGDGVSARSQSSGPLAAFPAGAQPAPPPPTPPRKGTGSFDSACRQTGGPTAPEATLSGPLPLSAVGRALVVRTIERDAALGRLGETPPQLADLPKPAASRALGESMGRFGLVMMLWMTLTGSLGMLLQAVVRERANRALESLLASAQAWEVVAGKVLGVGTISVLVLGAWLGAAAALAPLLPAGLGLGGAATLAGLANLARAALVYVMAFAFYGFVTVAIGAGARDTAQAQNLSRPMFAVLLAAFFVALASAGGAARALAWLVYVPPFTPFMLLLAPSGSMDEGAQAVALGLVAASAALAGWLAVRRLDLAPSVRRRLWPPAWAAPRG